MPLPDWRYKTVTLIAGKLWVVAELLRELMAAHSQTLGHVFRLLIARKPPAATKSQIRRFEAALAKVPPGFGGTEIMAIDDVYSVVSELRDVGIVDAKFLTDYRRCALVGTKRTSSATDLLGAVGHGISDLGGTGLAALLESNRLVAIIRTLDMETHAALQVVGSVDFCTEVARFFDERHVRRVHDVRLIHEEIVRL